MKSWLPVPRRPTTDQVASILAAEAGFQAARVSGTSAAVMRGAEPSMTRQVQYSQSA
jgi:2-methylisocitrate lyase-like PEP mutase family enzyme